MARAMGIATAASGDAGRPLWGRGASGSCVPTRSVGTRRKRMVCCGTGTSRPQRTARSLSVGGVSSPRETTCSLLSRARRCRIAAIHTAHSLARSSQVVASWPLAAPPLSSFVIRHSVFDVRHSVFFSRQVTQQPLHPLRLLVLPIRPQQRYRLRRILPHLAHRLPPTAHQGKVNPDAMGIGPR